MSFLKKIFSPAFFSFSILLLFYTFYKSEIIWNGDRRDYYLIYYIISLLFTFLSIVTFFINQKIKVYLIISSISIIFTFYLFEGFLIFKKELLRQEFLKSLPFQNQIKKEQLLREQLYEKQTGKKWDKRTKYEIYEDLKKKNDKIVMSVAPSNYLSKKNKYTIFPLSGISHSETINCNENWYYSIYKSDRHGFNNPDKEWDKKNIEYLLIGDSFTHGNCVNRPHDIGSVLRNLTNKSVLNLGYEGNNPLLEYATLREYLKKNTKKVLWIYFESDLIGLRKELKNNYLQKYITDLNFTQNLKKRHEEIDNEARNKIDEIIEYKFLRNKFNLSEFIKLFNTRNLIMKNFIPTKLSSQNQVKEILTESLSIDEILLEFKKILTLTKELTDKNNSKLYFISLPDYTNFSKRYDLIYSYKDSEKTKKSIKKIVSELKIPFIDISKEVFEKEIYPLKLFPFELHAHYNIDGYRKVSEAIYEFTND